MSKKTIKIDYNIGPLGKDSKIAGSYYFNSDSDEPAFIIKALKQSLNKLKIEKEKIVIGILNVFINGIKRYEIGFFKAGSLYKTDIKKLE